MPTDKYNRDFSNFGSYPWPGKNMPEYYDNMENAGDGNGGLQWMVQQAMSAYGPRQVISGIQVQSGAANSVTGTAGYFMWDGQIKQFTAASGTIAANQYAYISGDDSLNFTNTGAAAYTSGVLIAISGVGGITNVIQRWDANKLLYSLIDRLEVGQITGTHANIGYEVLSGTQITGTYGLIVNLNITIVSGSQITGTSGLINDIENTTISGSQFTYTSGVVGDSQYTTASGSQITGTSGLINNLNVDLTKFNYQTSAPSTTTGQGKIFSSGDGNIYYKDEHGFEFAIDYVKGWNFSKATAGEVSGCDAQGNGVRSISWKSDGTKFYTANQQNDRIYQYTPANPWSVSGAAYDSIYSPQFSEAGNYSDLRFSLDGKKVYINNQSQRIYQYSITGDAWDISTLSYDSIYLDVSGSSTWNVFLSTDGRYLYTTDNNPASDRVYRYTLLTGWNISGAECAADYYDLASIDTIYTIFSRDGSVMYAGDTSNEILRAWYLTIPWDISSATRNASDDLNVSAALSSFFYGLSASPNGRKIYCVDDNHIHEYDVVISL